MEVEVYEPSCLLILIITGKIIMNIFIFGARRRKVHTSFLGCFCVSLGVLDFALLVTTSVIHYFQDFAICGMRFTNYHICLFTQIISHAYGILHYPALLTAGLDYYISVVKSVNLHRFSLGFLHVLLTLLLWMAALSFALYSSVPPPASGPGLSSYQCTFYVSSQTYYLSAAVVCTIVLILGICCFEVVAFIKSMKLISFTNKTVLLFSCGDKWPIQGTRRLFTALVFSFLGTWAPYVLLQIILLILCAPIPGYMDMNVAWLYFMNSFLVGMAYGLAYPRIDLTRETFSIDPFISWKYCILPFIDMDYKVEDYLKEQLHPFMIV
ncbi:G protein-coupled receptor 160 L homeolog [Xenopus laevis]|uniref:G protein-coupled receptor 160 L homeolog n=1 Tax=Xenopus laevis TaxID=8355 RepID=Q7ZX01_XENLA|nr:G protein-coupled receptor 160 L homeolog [Xenopus laevis]AAH46372.1 MGC53783 protein [Xenopus laevis]